MLVAFCGIVAKKSTVNLFILFLAMLMHIIVASQFGLVAVVSKITIL